MEITARAKLKVEFTAPEHGWTIVKLSLGSESYQSFPSHTPYDSFGELIKALLNIIDGVPDAIVLWNDEPVEHKFVLIADSERVNFKVYEIIKSVTTGIVTDVERFSYEGNLYEVVRPFWKALRDMQSKQSSEDFRKHWQWTLPEREILELTQKLKSIKNAA